MAFLTSEIVVIFKLLNCLILTLSANRRVPLTFQISAYSFQERFSSASALAQRSQFNPSTCSLKSIREKIRILGCFRISPRYLSSYFLSSSILFNSSFFSRSDCRSLSSSSLILSRAIPASFSAIFFNSSHLASARLCSFLADSVSRFSLSKRMRNSCFSSLFFFFCS